MRDFASCFSEHAVRVSDSSCSGSSGSRGDAVLDPSIQTAVICLYRTRLSNLTDLFISISWFKTHTAFPELSVGIGRKPTATQWALRGRSGRQNVVIGSLTVGIYWDLSVAKYGAGPEPVSGFYVAVTVHAELAMWLGDGEFIKQLRTSAPTALFSIVSRREEVVGRGAYVTRARFSEGGGEHEIGIRCANSELSVSVDGKRVVHVGRLEYNFRGNQTLFVDGLPVDLLWDVHGWWFGSGRGGAVLMFRTRSALESRLWLEEEMVCKEKGVSGFSLVIQAFKS